MKSPKKSKALEFKLKEKKEKEYLEKKYFNNLTEVLISFHLFPFFSETEAFDFGTIDIKFYNSFMRFCQRRFENRIPLYNIDLKNQEFITQNDIYQQKDDKGHYLKFGIFSIEHYCLFAENKWTWQEDKRYWEKITAKNTILNKDIFSLIYVCWVDVNQTITHIFYGKYKLYLNHCVCNLNTLLLKLTVYLDNEPIFETKYPSKEQKDKCRERHAKSMEEDNNNKNKGRMGLFRGLRLPLKDQYKVELKEKKVDKDFITIIDIPYNKIKDNDEGHCVTVRFDHVEGSWKKGWLIDAFILEKILGNTNDK